MIFSPEPWDPQTCSGTFKSDLLQSTTTISPGPCKSSNKKYLKQHSTAEKWKNNIKPKHVDTVTIWFTVRHEIQKISLVSSFKMLFNEESSSSMAQVATEMLCIGRIWVGGGSFYKVGMVRWYIKTPPSPQTTPANQTHPQTHSTCTISPYHTN